MKREKIIIYIGFIIFCSFVGWVAGTTIHEIRTVGLKEILLGIWEGPPS